MPGVRIPEGSPITALVRWLGGLIQTETVRVRFPAGAPYPRLRQVQRSALNPLVIGVRVPARIPFHHLSSEAEQLFYTEKVGLSKCPGGTNRRLSLNMS